MTTRARGPIGLALFSLAACAQGPVAMDDTAASVSAQASHPIGVIAATTPLGSRPFGAAISSTGRVLITQLDAAAVGMGTLPSTALAGSIPVGNIPTNVRFDVTGNNAFVTNQVDNTVGFLKPALGTQVGTVSLPSSTFNVAFCSANKRLYVTGPGAFVAVINAVTRTLVDSIATSAVTNGVVATKTCTRVFVSDESNDRVLEIDPATNQIVRTLATGGSPKDLAVSDNGKRLFVADETGAIQVWNLVTGTRVISIPTPAGVFGIAISPDSKVVYGGMPSGGGVVVVSTASNTITSTIVTGGTPRKIAFDAAGTTAVVANEGGWVDYIN